MATPTWHQSLNDLIPSILDDSIRFILEILRRVEYENVGSRHLRCNDVMISYCNNDDQEVHRPIRNYQGGRLITVPKFRAD